MQYSNNTNAGTATITITGKGDYTGTATGIFTINKAAPTYTAPTKKTGLTYTGSAQALLNAGSTSHGTFYYSTDNSTWSTSIPTQINANTSGYTVYWKLTGDSNHSDVASTTISGIIIAKATGVAGVSSRSLTYNRSAQNLVAVSGNTGTVHYRLGTSGSWSTTIPTATNASTSYKVYYYVDASTNYNAVGSSSSPSSVTSSIAKVTPVVSTSPSKRTGLSYTGSNQNLLSGGSMKFSSSDSTAVAGTFSYAQGKNAGIYSSLTWSFTPTDTTNYNSTSGTVSGSVSIARADRTLSFSSPTTVVQTSGNVTNTATPSAGSGDGTITYTISSTTYATINSSTGKVTAKTSEGSAVVTATISQGTNYNSAAVSYTINIVQYNTNGLVFLLDGKMKGGDASNWVDLAGGIRIPFKNCTVNSDHILFDKSGYMDTSFSGSFPSSSYTIEVVVEAVDVDGLVISTGNSGLLAGFTTNGFTYSPTGMKGCATATTDRMYSVNGDRCVINGREVYYKDMGSWSNVSDGVIRIGGYVSWSHEYDFSGKIFSIRIYNRKLTKAEMQANQNVDNTRFGFGVYMDESYVSNGLVFQLDGIDKGSDANNWIDQIGGLKFPYGTAATKGTNYVQFGGTGSIKATSSTAFPQTSCTIEACCDNYDSACMLLYPSASGNILLGKGGGGSRFAYGSQTAPIYPRKYTKSTSPTLFISANADGMIERGVSLSTDANDYWANEINGTIKIGGRDTGYFYTGKMYAIRIYNRKLSPSEIIQNQRLDNNRFGINTYI